jgi:hypothetical protein
MAQFSDHRLTHTLKFFLSEISMINSGNYRAVAQADANIEVMALISYMPFDSSRNTEGS